MNVIFDMFEPKLIAKDYITKYATLTQIAQKKSYNADGEIIGELKFPVAVGVSADCFNTGEVYDLVPDSNERGIAYFEIIGDSRFELTDGFPKKYNFIKMSIPARLILWQNLPRLGFTDVSRPDNLSYVGELSDIINIAGVARPTGVQNIRILRKSFRIGNEIFDRYTYTPKMKTYIDYPYAVYSLEFDINILVSENCIPDIHKQAIIQCP